MPVYAGVAGVTGSVRLTLSIRDSNGTLASATAVTVTVILPDGTTTTPAVTNDGTGLYHADYSPAAVGHYGVYWVATGSNAGTLEESFDVNDLTISPPLGLAQVKDHLNIPQTTITDDDELRGFILAATGLVEGVVGPLTRRPVSETYNGGRAALILKQAPVISVTTVTESGTTVAASGYSISTDTGVLTRTSGYSASVWTQGFNNVTVSYVAGRTQIPADLTHAVLETVRHLWTTQRGSVKRSQTDDYQPGAGFSLPNRVRELLSRYEMPGIS